MSDTTAILAVCTGNVCRSPVVERLLRVGLARQWPEAFVGLPVSSAGTHAMVGHSIPSPLMTRLAAHGAESAVFASRQLTVDMVADADLVVALTRAHRAAVVELYPRAVRFTFTLRELGRLTSALPPGDRAPIEPRPRLAAFVTAAAACRGMTAVADPRDDDVIDPYRGSDARYQEAWGQLTAGVEALLRAMVPAPASMPAPETAPQLQPQPQKRAV